MQSRDRRRSHSVRFFLLLSVLAAILAVLLFSTSRGGGAVAMANVTVGGEVDHCKLQLEVVCLGVFTEVSGVVWGPCEYNGDVVLSPSPPINWHPAWGYVCRAAGKVRNETYVVFVREALAQPPSRTDPFPENLVLKCYARYVKNKTIVMNPVLYPVYVLLVVNVNKSVGYLTFVYRAPTPFRNATVVFSNSGVYIALPEWAEVGVKREILGPVLSRCSYVVNATIDVSKLRLGEPLYNATGSFLRISTR